MLRGCASIDLHASRVANVHDSNDHAGRCDYQSVSSFFAHKESHRVGCIAIRPLPDSKAQAFRLDFPDTRGL